MNLPKRKVLSHSKAGFGARKNRMERFEILFGKLGFRKDLSSLYYPVRSSAQDDCSKNENRVDLAQFRTFLMQPVVMTKFNFWNSKFALLS